MAKLTKENWIMLGVAAAIVAGAIMLVYRPQKAALHGVRAQIAAQKLTLEADRSKAKVIPQIMRKVQELKSRYKDFDQRLPKSKELGGFLQEITGIQSGSELSDARMETGSPVSEELYNTMPIQMKFRGSYLALAKFLKDVDGMQRLTRVQRLLIRSTEVDGGPLEIDLMMNIYFTKS